jgi:hypothetical protein
MEGFHRKRWWRLTDWRCALHLPVARMRDMPVALVELEKAR